MKPIQVWLPQIHGGVAHAALQRDRQRALREWDGEHVVWIIPGWDRPARWNEPGTRVLALSGNQLECIRVCHVGANGTVVGPSAAAFPEMSASNILDNWLTSSVAFQPVAPEARQRIALPARVEGGFTYVECEIETRPGSYLPITGIDDESRTVQLRWPPEANGLSPVSPEVESAERMLTAEGSSGMLRTRLAWAPPFDKLMPMFSSPDDIFARDLMCNLVKLSGSDLAGARNRAQTEAHAWVSEGQSTINQSWFIPIMAAEGAEGALSVTSSKYDLPFMSLEDAYQHPDWQELLRRRVPIQRAWGVPGLCWALFCERLDRTGGFRHCERCGRPLHGHPNKRFCHREDDEECFRQQKREQKQKERRR